MTTVARKSRRVTIEMILAQHDEPVFFVDVLVTPDMAAAMLDNNADYQRKLNPVKVRKYERVLRADRWKLIHNGVAMDRNGRCQDGQKRLAAIRNTGIAARMVVSCGWPPENYEVFDTGERRTNAQTLVGKGAKDATTAAAAVRVIHTYWDQGEELLRYRKVELANDEVAETYEKLEVEPFNLAILRANRVYNEIGGSKGGVAAALYLVDRAMLGDARVEAFAETLITGTGDRSDPVWVLRRTFTRRQRLADARAIEPRQQFVLMIKGWNAYITGHVITDITARTDSAAPAILTGPNDARAAAAKGSAGLF